MRCKKHYTDLSSIVGVCACCLRERLLHLIAAQEQAIHAQSQGQNLDGKPVFPCSDSPFNNSRKSDRRKDRHPYTPAAPRHNHSFSDQLFYRTPQVGPTTGAHNNTVIHSNKKRSLIRFLTFPNIFRSRNRNSVDSDSDPRASDSTFREPYGGGNATSSTSSSSWFSTVIHGGRNRRKQPIYDDESIGAGGSGVVRRQFCRDRGMSPARNSDGDGGVEDYLFDATSGYESRESWKNTPRRTPAHLDVRRGGGGGGGHVRNLSGLTFCLSPLVRASPNRQWNNQKGIPPDGGLSGEIRAPVKPHLSNIKSFCPNRSRKFADFGRPNAHR